MSGKFMKTKRVILPTLVLVALLAQSSTAFALTPGETANLIKSSPTITMELAEVDAITSAAPVYTENGERVVYAANTESNAKVTDIAQFTDYSKDLGYGQLSKHWAKDHIQVLLTHNGIKGNPDGSFAANKNITTAELVSIILNTSGNTPTGETTWPTSVMEKAVDLGIIPTSMKNEGNTPISREKMALVLVNSAKNIRNEDTSKLPEISDNRISDISQADSAYKQSIKAAYSLGLLVGDTNGAYNPKKPTTRGETCVIINRLFEYSAREEVKENLPPPVEGLTALPDGSNVGKSGVIYPKEGDIINGVKVTRDPATGILGLGNGGKGGIYLGIKYPTNGATIQVGSEAAVDGYDNMGGTYEQRGDYIFWTDEFSLIQRASDKNVDKIDNPTNGMNADIFGNQIKSGSNETAFYLFNGDYWEYIW